MKAVMVVYMWGYARMARRVDKLNASGLPRATALKKAAQMMVKSTRLGILLPMGALGVTVIGGEEIVGSLTAKVRGDVKALGGGGVGSNEGFSWNPCTNKPRSHFCSNLNTRCDGSLPLAPYFVLGRLSYSRTLSPRAPALT